MPRISLIIVVLLLAACGHQNSSRLREGPAGLDVARAALAGGTPEIALKVSNGILDTEPRNLPALLVRADALSALGRLNEAQVAYADVLAVHPSSAEAKLGLGRLRLQSDPAQAQTLLSSVVEHDARNKLALNDLGIAYDLQGEHASAQGAYRRALGIDPTMQAAEVNLALSLALSGHAADAVEILRPLAAAPGAIRRVREDLAMALTLTGNRQEATQILGAELPADQVEAALAAYQAFGL